MAQGVIILKKTKLIGVYVHSLSKINRKALNRNYVTRKPFLPNLRGQTIFQTTDREQRLESRVGVLEQHLKVSLEPGASLRSGLECIRVATVSIVTSSAGVAGAITLSTRLDPNDGVDERVAGVGGWAHAKAGVLHIAPVAPGLLARRLHSAAALVDDEVGREAVLLQERGDGVDEQLLVVVLVALGVGGRGGGVVAVVVGDVGHEAAEGGGLAGFGVDSGEELGRRREVGLPAEPACVACIDVHGDVGEIERLDCVFDTGDVGGLGFLASDDVHVGDQIAETVGLW